ncbi:unnamed protein product [Prorocentrum cordatum]|uniref:Uncharacterized protein n=1 Tax=Prorocentrum cordatum TaxID=2364126 RepID=A0ABN9Q9I8_9DINO|nr:unnamed protein product [Polarella glacialis]CAK0904782.1 unnamed protein product [Polarella glacialis]
MKHFAVGTMETVEEALGIGRPSSGSTDAPDASACRDLKECSGAAQVRQPCSASVGSPIAGTGSRNLPPVLEHEVLTSQEAQDCPAAAPPSSPKCLQQLAHQEYKPTPPSTQSLSLALLLLQWNVPVLAGSCCLLHAALYYSDRTSLEFRRVPCNLRGDSLFRGQCDQCGLLMFQHQSCCEFCDAPAAASVGTDASLSGGTISA